MRVSRLFVDLPLESGREVALDAEAAHYLRSVLRLKAGQQVVLFNGRGGEFGCRLLEVSRQTVRAVAETHMAREVESPLVVRLGLGISRGDRMDWSLQKAVELGVCRLTPLTTEHCVIRLDAGRQQQRHQHWQGIIHHAAEQCGRTRLPLLEEVTALPAWVSDQQGLKVFLDPYAEHSLGELPAPTDCLTLLSGPEGGFSDREREIARGQGFIPVRMGARILRTETAVLAALTAAQTLWGDFR